MAYLLRRRGVQGLGATALEYCSGGRLNWLTSASCWSKPLAQWQSEAASLYTAAPRPPTPAELAAGEASGDFAGLQQKLADEQLRAQQGQDAAAVEPVYAPVSESVLDLPDTLNPFRGLGGGLSVMAMLAIGVVAAVGIAAVGAGSPRRYGR